MMMLRKCVELQTKKVFQTLKHCNTTAADVTDNTAAADVTDNTAAADVTDSAADADVTDNTTAADVTDNTAAADVGNHTAANAVCNTAEANTLMTALRQKKTKLCCKTQKNKHFSLLKLQHLLVLQLMLQTSQTELTDLCIHLPSTIQMLAIGRIYSPQTLYQSCSCWNLSVKMFLSLLLLYFQCKT